MVEPHDVKRRMDEITNLIAGNEVQTAFAKLQDFAKDFARNPKKFDEAINFCMQIRAIEEAHRQGTLSSLRSIKERSRLVFAALDLMRKIAAELAEPMLA